MLFFFIVALYFASHSHKSLHTPYSIIDIWKPSLGAGSFLFEIPRWRLLPFFFSQRRQQLLLCQLHIPSPKDLEKCADDSPCTVNIKFIQTWEESLRGRGTNWRYHISWDGIDKDQDEAGKYIEEAAELRSWDDHRLMKICQLGAALTIDKRFWKDGNGITFEFGEAVKPDGPEKGRLLQPERSQARGRQMGL